MKVTEVRINPAKGGKVRAFASVVFDDCFIVNDLRVIEGREGQVFVTMPARKTRNGQMRDIAHPLNSETREQKNGEKPVGPRPVVSQALQRGFLDERRAVG
jgi:stage V sporulation protein G